MRNIKSIEDNEKVGLLVGTHWFWINMQIVTRKNYRFLLNSIPNCVVRFQGCRDWGAKIKNSVFSQIRMSYYWEQNEIGIQVKAFDLVDIVKDSDKNAGEGI